MRGFLTVGLAALAGSFALSGAIAEPQAIAVLTPASSSTVTGKIIFSPPSGDNPDVRVDISLENLAPNSEHGFHIHAFGDISDPKGLATGGHFNPFNTTHACDNSTVRHAGDIGNVQADAEGKVQVTKYVKASLVPGEPDSIFGRGIIVHEKADDCVTQPTGNAGGRFAQGVIGLATNFTGKANPSRPSRRTLGLAARAVLTPTTISTNFSITGTVTFTTDTKSTFLHLNLTGFEPKSIHGFHIHSFGNLSSVDGTALGGHFNPYGKNHSCPTTAGEERHAGDFGNIQADDTGAVITTLESDLISLDPSAETAIYGRAVVVHELQDDCVSPTTGNAGRRFAQGVIGVANRTAVGIPDEVPPTTATATYEPTQIASETDSYVDATETSTSAPGYYIPEVTTPVATETETYEETTPVATETETEEETYEETTPVATETETEEETYEETTPVATETESSSDSGYDKYEETTPVATETETETYEEETTPVATETKTAPSYGEETTPVATETETHSAPSYGKPEETTPVATATETETAPSYSEETTPVATETETYSAPSYGKPEETTPVATETETAPSYGEETTPVATETETAPSYGEATTPVATETETYESITEEETTPVATETAPSYGEETTPVATETETYETVTEETTPVATETETGYSEEETTPVPTETVPAYT
ncbi:hypothetical protein HDV00_005407 [Rhizophlyctis rosea]|nr:hypothetical protein HDV00_005407 [Rhizophlyctis rosea]